MTSLTRYFDVEEFTASDTAARRGIDNQLPDDLRGAAMSTALMLEGIRDHLSTLAGRQIPIMISSGYRSPALNLAIGSSSTSDHPKACAADIKAPDFGSAFAIASALSSVVDDLHIGQLIYEFGAWVHVSTKMVGNPINRIITIDRLGTQVGICEVRK